jgi:hypothetical protein
MRKVILHIGLHKTGSSAIQAAAAMNKEQIISAGYYYPAFGETRCENHSIPLSLLFKSNPQNNPSVLSQFPEPSDRESAKKQFKAALYDELNNYPSLSIIFSGEDISLFETEELSGLKQFIFSEMGINDLSVVAYVRNPLSLALSGAQELVRAGRMTLGEALSIGNLLQAKLKIERIRNVFSADRVIVYDYDKAIQDYGDITKHFFKKISVTINSKNYIRRNESMSFEKTLVLSTLIKASPDLAKKCLKVLPNKGSRLYPNTYIATHVLNAAQQDIDYLDSQFGINYRHINFTDVATLDPTVLVLFCDIAIQLSRQGNSNPTISRAGVFKNMCADIDPFFPDLATQLSVLGYNVSQAPSLKLRVDDHLRCGRLKGEYVGDVFIDYNDHSIVNGFDKNSYLVLDNVYFSDLPSDFDPIHYLILNPDVLQAGVNPQSHYLNHGKKENRKYQL